MKKLKRKSVADYIAELKVNRMLATLQDVLKTSIKVDGVEDPSATLSLIKTKVGKKAKNDDEVIDVVIMRHYDRNGNHPHVMVDTVDDKNVSVGLTTNKNNGKNNTTNYPLDMDPLGSDKKVYMRREGTVDKKNRYRDPKKGTMTKRNFKKAKVYAQIAKEDYKKKK